MCMIQLMKRHQKNVCSFIGFKSFPIREYVTPLGILDHYYIKLHAHAIAFYFTDPQDRRMLKREYMDVLAHHDFPYVLAGTSQAYFVFGSHFKLVRYQY